MVGATVVEKELSLLCIWWLKDRQLSKQLKIKTCHQLAASLSRGQSADKTKLNTSFSNLSEISKSDGQ